MSMFDNALGGIIAKAEATMRTETGHENDYMGPEGLLMCGTCHARRQMVLEVPMIGTRVVPVMCKCDIASWEAEKARKAVEAAHESLKGLRSMGAASTSYQNMTFDADDGGNASMATVARRYVEEWAEMYRENIGLLFHGGVGGGKTFWAAAIANALLEKGTSAVVTSTPALITAMSRDYERNKAFILDEITRVGLLVLDDIGFERQTSYAAEKMYEIIDTRYRAKRPLIITTNLSLEEISNPQLMEYKRVFDRIIEMCQPVHVNAEGRRKTIARNKSDLARKILGL